MITPDELLEFAILKDIQSQSEVAIRRAISAAYYAAFHAVAWAGAEMFYGPPQLQQKLARSYDHGTVRAMAGEMERHAKQPGANAAFATVARYLVLLRETRETADYDLQADLTWEDGLKSIILAREVLSLLKDLKTDPAFASLILLPLLRDRSRRG